MAQTWITSFFKRAPAADESGGAFSSSKKRERDDGPKSAAATNSKAGTIADPFRFRHLHVRQQRLDFDLALHEIEKGRKQDHWIWWIIPTPPNVENGVELASLTNKKYALRDRPGALQGDLAAVAYLNFPAVDGIHLRTNYLRIMRAALTHLENKTDPAFLMGSETDAKKLRKSAELFERASRAAGAADEEVNEVCLQILAAFDAFDAAAAQPRNSPSLLETDTPRDHNIVTSSEDKDVNPRDALAISGSGQNDEASHAACLLEEGDTVGEASHAACLLEEEDPAVSGEEAAAMSLPGE